MKKYVDVLNKLIRRCVYLHLPFQLRGQLLAKVQVPPEASTGVRSSGPSPVRQPLVPTSEGQVCHCNWPSALTGSCQRRCSFESDQGPSGQERSARR